MSSSPKASPHVFAAYPLTDRYFARLRDRVSLDREQLLTLLHLEPDIPYCYRDQAEGKLSTHPQAPPVWIIDPRRVAESMGMPVDEALVLIDDMADVGLFWLGGRGLFDWADMENDDLWGLLVLGHPDHPWPPQERDGRRPIREALGDWLARRYGTAETKPASAPSWIPA